MRACIVIRRQRHYCHYMDTENISVVSLRLCIEVGCHLRETFATWVECRPKCERNETSKQAVTKRQQQRWQQQRNVFRTVDIRAQV